VLTGLVILGILLGLACIRLLLDLRHEVRHNERAILRNSEDIGRNTQVIVDNTHDIRRNTEDIRTNTVDIQDSSSLVATHVGHELRTPLTTIMGTLATLEKHHDRIPPAKLCNMLRDAVRQAEVLESLIAGMISLEPSGDNEPSSGANVG
jgi:two-component system, OmpR family, sensor histidine kinase KdpD